MAQILYHQDIISPRYYEAKKLLRPDIISPRYYFAKIWLRQDITALKYYFAWTLFRQDNITPRYYFANIIFRQYMTAPRYDCTKILFPARVPHSSELPVKVAPFLLICCRVWPEIAHRSSPVIRSWIAVHCTELQIKVRDFSLNSMFLTGQRTCFAKVSKWFQN